MAFSSLVALAVAALAVFGTFVAAPAFALAAGFVVFLVAVFGAARPPDRSAFVAGRLVLVVDLVAVAVEFTGLARVGALAPDLGGETALPDPAALVELSVLARDAVGLDGFVDFVAALRLLDPPADFLAPASLPDFAVVDFAVVDTVLFLAAVPDFPAVLDVDAVLDFAAALGEALVAAFRAARARSAIRPPYICKNGRAARLPRTPEWSRIRTPSPSDNAPRELIPTTRYLRRRSTRPQRRSHSQDLEILLSGTPGPPCQPSLTRHFAEPALREIPYVNRGHDQQAVAGP